jgi:hypothetical protein
MSWCSGFHHVIEGIPIHSDGYHVGHKSSREVMAALSRQSPWYFHRIEHE